MVTPSATTKSVVSGAKTSHVARGVPEGEEPLNGKRGLASAAGGRSERGLPGIATDNDHTADRSIPAQSSAKHKNETNPSRGAGRAGDSERTLVHGRAAAVGVRVA